MSLVGILLKSGADVETQDGSGQRPLHRATVNNHHLMVSELLESGADINATTTTGCTALHLAIISRSTEVLRILLGNVNLDFNIRDLYGGTLLHHAAYHGDIQTMNTLRSRSFNRLDYTEDDQPRDSYTAKQYSQWRRDFNADWSRTYEQPCDPDPDAWYDAFEELFNSVRSPRLCDVGEITKEGDDEISEDSTISFDTDQRCWQDALEELC